MVFGTGKNMKHLILFSLLVVLGACTKNMEYPTERVTYAVEGTAKDFTVQYYEPGCGFQEVEGLNGSWQHSFTQTLDSSGGYANLMAKSGYNGYEGASLTVKILINGKVVKQKTDEGRYNLVYIDYTSGCECR
jgi:hypothetical protein